MVNNIYCGYDLDLAKHLTYCLIAEACQITFDIVALMIKCVQKLKLVKVATLYCLEKVMLQR